MRRSNRIRKSRFGLRAAAVVAVAVLATSACSSSGNKGSAGGTPTFTGTLKIGMIIWNSPAIVLNVPYPGIKAAIRAINAKGGVNSQQLVFDNCEAADPNSLDACARKMVSDGVVATVRDATIIDDPSIEKILSDAGIPEIDPFLFAPASYANPNAFLLSGGAPTQFAVVPSYMKLVGLKTYHFIYGISPAANANMDIVRNAAKVSGVTEKGTATGVALTAADYSPAVADTAAAGADITISVESPFATNLILKADQQLGKNLRFGLDNQFTNAQAQQLGQPGGPLDKALLVDAVPPDTDTKDFPALNTYHQEVQAELQSGDAAADISQMQPLALLGWLDVHVLANVLKGIKGTVTAAAVKQAFESAKNLDTLGLTPPWTPSAAGPASYPRISNPWMWLFTVKNGTFVMQQTKPVNILKAMGG